MVLASFLMSGSRKRRHHRSTRVGSGPQAAFRTIELPTNDLPRTFVHGHGHCYLPLYNRMQEILSLEDETLPPVMSHMLPAVFHTLVVLTEKKTALSIGAQVVWI